MNNPEKLATYGTQDEDKQNKNTTRVSKTCIHLVNVVYACIARIKKKTLKRLTPSQNYQDHFKQ